MMRNLGRAKPNWSSRIDRGRRPSWCGYACRRQCRGDARRRGHRSGIGFQPAAGINCPASAWRRFPRGRRWLLLPKAVEAPLLRWGGSVLVRRLETSIATPAERGRSVQCREGPGPAPPPAPSGRRLLISGVPITGNVEWAAGVTYKFVAVAGRRITFPSSNPHSRSSARHRCV